MKQKLFFLILALTTFITAQAYDFQYGDLFYNITSDTEPFTVEVTQNYNPWNGFNYTGLATAEIPETVENGGKTYSVTSISSSAFSGCSGLTSITIPNSVTSIDERAFYDCSGLTSVTIPNSVTSIGYGAFEYCSGLTSVTIPNSVTYIGSDAFRGCRGLTSIEIPNSVTSINDGAFSHCSGLTSVTIPNSVKYIGLDAFYGVRHINYNGSATGSPWGAYSINGITDGDFVYSDADKQTLIAYIGNGGNVTIPNSVTSIGSDAFRGCSGLTSVNIPNSVTSIGDYAFSGCDSITTLTYNTNAIGSIFSGKKSLKTVNIGDSVTSIGDLAFCGCSGLTSVTIPNSVTNIGNNAFYGCDKLTFNEYGNALYLDLGNSENPYLLLVKAKSTDITSCEINQNCRFIYNYAFDGCSGLTSVTIPNSVTNIGSSAFYGCSGLTSVTIPNSVTSIGDYAFFGCSGLTSVNIPNLVTSIGSSAFYGCSGLTSISFAEYSKLTIIGDNAFYNCSGLTSIDIPNSVTSIGNSAFAYCENLTSIKIPNSAKEIGKSAFYYCIGLTSVEIPTAVTNIYHSAFEGCKGLSAIEVDWEWPLSIESNVFKDVYLSNIKLYVPNGAKAKYMATNVWKNFNIVEGSLMHISLPINNDTYGTVSGSGTYVANDTVAIKITISATPNNGYHFEKWSDGNTANPRQIIATQDTAFTAIFGEHVIAISKAVSPTCTTTGLTEGKHCSVCDSVLVAQQTIPMLEHSFTNYIYNNDATAEADGTETALCDNGCGEKDTRVAEGTKLVGIDDAEASAVNIYAHHNIIVVENADAEIGIFDVTGRCVARSEARHVSMAMPRQGLYIVKVGAIATRVVVE